MVARIEDTLVRIPKQSEIELPLFTAVDHDPLMPNPPILP
jgi:hypothetical protein